jgi:MtN3 and saliva related transmembrane protein
MNVEWFGIAAGALTTCAFLPQVAKTMRSRSTGDLSWIWLIMMSLGVFLWMIYGYFKASPSVFFANVFTLACLLALVFAKGWRAPQADDGAVEYVTVRRKVGGCIGFGRCNTGCPLIVEYREKINKPKQETGH